MRDININILLGDITKIPVDAIVNAANSSLMGGGGVDGAIHRTGGVAIVEECKEIVAKFGKCLTGKAVITNAGKLPANFVIHTVGPVWRGGTENEEEALKACYRNSLKIAVENNCKSISFPNISTGAYHFPQKFAAQIAVGAVIDFIKEFDLSIHIIFVCYSESNYNCIKEQLSIYSIIN